MGEIIFYFSLYARKRNLFASCSKKGKFVLLFKIYFRYAYSSVLRSCFSNDFGWYFSVLSANSLIYLLSLWFVWYRYGYHYNLSTTLLCLLPICSVYHSVLSATNMFCLPLCSVCYHSVLSATPLFCLLSLCSV